MHSLGQTAHFHTASTISPRDFYLGLNTALPRTISIRSVEETQARFDARRSACKKLYRYSIWNDVVRAGLRDRYARHVCEPLDVARTRTAAAHLVGRHDFSAFRATDCDRLTTVRTLHRVEFARKDELITIEVEGDASATESESTCAGDASFASALERRHHLRATVQLCAGAEPVLSHAGAGPGRRSSQRIWWRPSSGVSRSARFTLASGLLASTCSSAPP